MNDIQKKYLANVVTALFQMKCDFAIIDPLGKKHGLLDVVIPKERAKRRRSIHAVGALSNHIKEHILHELKIGEVVVILAGEFGLVAVQSAVGAMLTKKYGKNTHMTGQDKASYTVQVMRVA